MGISLSLNSTELLLDIIKPSALMVIKGGITNGSRDGFDYIKIARSKVFSIVEDKVTGIMYSIPLG